MTVSETQRQRWGTGEVLTLAEIEARFPSEWVLIEDPDVGENLEIIRGPVLWHSKDRDEVYQQAIDLGAKSAATVYVGPWPENMEYVL